MKGPAQTIQWAVPIVYCRGAADDVADQIDVALAAVTDRIGAALAAVACAHETAAAVPSFINYSRNFSPHKLVHVYCNN